MRRIGFGVMAVVVTSAACLALLRPVWADQATTRKAPAPPAGVRRDLEDLEARLADLAERHRALRKEFETLRKELEALRTAFRRHTHAVKFWDAARRKAVPWKEQGSFFITQPRVADGETDADAVKAGGTWGTP